MIRQNTIFGNSCDSLMRPSKKSKVDDPRLINNTLSLCRRHLETFDPTCKPSLTKDSKVYIMLRYGPLPDGDYSYLIKDGEITRYARWLLIACDLNMSFMTMLILAKVYCSYIDTRNSDNRYIGPDIQREDLYGEMGFDFKHQSIVEMITTLKKLGYCQIGVWHSIRGIPDVMDALEKCYDSEFRQMYGYFEFIFPRNINNELTV